MKVLDIKDQLDVGDSKLIRVKVLEKSSLGILVSLGSSNDHPVWISDDSDISIDDTFSPEKVVLTERQDEIMEKAIGKSLYVLLGLCTPDEEELLAKARLYGYTIETEYHWAVKRNSGFLEKLRIDDNLIIDATYNDNNFMKFTDHDKASAVAVMVGGKVVPV